MSVCGPGRHDDPVYCPIRGTCQPGKTTLVRDRPAEIIYCVSPGIIDKQVCIKIIGRTIPVSCAAVYPSILSCCKVMDYERCQLLAEAGEATIWKGKTIIIRKVRRQVK